MFFRLDTNAGQRQTLSALEESNVRPLDCRAQSDAVLSLCNRELHREPDNYLASLSGIRAKKCLKFDSSWLLRYFSMSNASDKAEKTDIVIHY